MTVLQRLQHSFGRDVELALAGHDLPDHARYRPLKTAITIALRLVSNEAPTASAGPAPAVVRDEPEGAGRAVVPSSPSTPTTSSAPDVPALVFHQVVPDGAADRVSAPSRLPLRSESCSSHHFQLDAFRHWMGVLGETPRLHRKQWEFFFVAQVLHERGLLRPGSGGLGFGVGREPLTAAFAAAGCEVLGTDLALEAAREAGWVSTNEHADSLSGLNERGLCDPEAFARLVSFRNVDMTDVPEDLTGFDFCWSACALEHLGGIQAGLDFIERSIATVRPGGYAVHTTELKVDDGPGELLSGGTVVFRREDLERLITRLGLAGHEVEPLLVHTGSHLIDAHVDVPPYSAEPHLRLALEGLVTTSVGIVVRRGGGAPA